MFILLFELLYSIIKTSKYSIHHNISGYNRIGNIYEPFDNPEQGWDVIDKTGINDSANILSRILSIGGDITIPVGTYLINNPVIVNLNKKTNIKCETGVKFISGPINSTMITFVGNRLYPNINFNWYGGTFYQNNQKTSILSPFINEYKPQGLSNRSQSESQNGFNALSILGSYSLDNVSYSFSINKCVIDSVVCYGGDNNNKSDSRVHWETSGGDNGIFIEGVKVLSINNCKMVGNRDCGISISSCSNGIYKDNMNVSIQNNILINCFNGVICKKSCNNVFMMNNTVTNCIKGLCVEYINGNGSKNVTIQSNNGSKCNIFVQVQKTTGFTISSNKFNSIGALLNDNKTVGLIPNNYFCLADIFMSSNGKVIGNSIFGITNQVRLSNTLMPQVIIFKILNNSLVVSPNNIYQNNLIQTLDNKGTILDSDINGNQTFRYLGR